MLALPSVILPVISAPSKPSRPLDDLEFSVSISLFPVLGQLHAYSKPVATSPQSSVARRQPVPTTSPACADTFAHARDFGERGKLNADDAGSIQVQKKGPAHLHTLRRSVWSRGALLRVQTPSCPSSYKVRPDLFWPLPLSMCCQSVTTTSLRPQHEGCSLLLTRLGGSDTEQLTGSS